MADPINEDYIKSALRSKLQAETVEVTDVSGMFPFVAILSASSYYLSNNPRWLWPGVYRRHRVPPVLRAQLAQAPPPRQRGPARRDCKHPCVERQVPHAG